MRVLSLTKIGCILLIVIFSGCSREITDKDISSVDISLQDQQKMILSFEKEIECDAHSPCFYAVVDGALERNPRKAQTLCREALKNIKSVDVPEKLPPEVRTKLESAQKELIKDTEVKLGLADARVNHTAQSVSFGQSVTCNAYAIVKEINTAYQIDEMMQGQYINCDVLSSIDK